MSTAHALTVEQIDTLVSDLARAVLACPPKIRSNPTVLSDPLYKRLTRIAAALSLPAPIGPLLPPETMPWREVREPLADACALAAGGAVETARHAFKRAIALATGAAR